jgi:hypothetical protein
MRSEYELRHSGVKGMKWRNHKALTEAEKLRLAQQARDDVAGWVKEDGSAEKTYDDVIEQYGSPEQIRQAGIKWQKLVDGPRLAAMRKRKVSRSKIRKMAAKMSKSLAENALYSTTQVNTALAGKARILKQKERQYEL